MSALEAIATLAATLGLAACGGPTPAPPTARTGPVTAESTLASCGMYAALPAAFGYCLTSRAPELVPMEEMERLCTRAGTWEGPCRDAWVVATSQRPDPPSAQVLLQACGPSADCAFKVIDTGRAADDVLGDIRLCHAYASRYEADCVRHALTRWVAGRRPDAEEIARVRAGAPNHAVNVGWFAGVVAACLGTAACDEDASAFSANCRAGQADLLRDLRGCPAR